MATSQRAKELAHQVDYLTKVIGEMDDENATYRDMYGTQTEANEELRLKVYRLRKYITDNIEKGNQ